MHLYSKNYSDSGYYKEAKKIKHKILEIVDAEAQHMEIRNIQDIFRKNEKRLYHWASYRRVPADNNRTEGDLRSTVIARKVSFGSQSLAGAKARSILMTIFHTVRKKLLNSSIEEWIKLTKDLYEATINYSESSWQSGRAFSLRGLITRTSLG